MTGYGNSLEGELLGIKKDFGLAYEDIELIAVEARDRGERAGAELGRPLEKLRKIHDDIANAADRAAGMRELGEDDPP